MKLSTRARYALRAMLALARLGADNGPVNLNIISEKTSISRRYLEQVLIPLKNANLVRGVSGKKGGYLLAKPAEQIRIGDIVEAAIGKINIVECVNEPGTCSETAWCECRPLYSMINTKIVNAMNEFTLADLSDEDWMERINADLNVTDTWRYCPPT
jgi:Rrf2 family protein